MTSMPASRRARAMTLAPRSWPSRPGFAMSTRIGRSAPLSFAIVREEFINSLPQAARRQLAREVLPGAPAVRHAVLLLAGHLGERPRIAVRHEHRVPTEPARAARRGGDRSPGAAERGHELRAVEVRQGAGRRRAALLEGLEHPRDRRDAGRALEPFDER